MFEGSLISNFLDQERYDKVNISNYKQDSYILYNRDGEMVISTLIDIEVVFRKNTNIKKKIMIDSKNINMNILNRKILEVCEIFPKLSGLNRLYPINLMKKTENGEIYIKEGVNNLKSKDIIIFDLIFYEIWLEIQMTLKCGNTILKKN